jgi:hypothetical protein
MAITTSAPNGVIVTTAAMNEVIPAQTNVSDTTLEVEVSDDITTLSNGNLVTSPVYTSRLIILRQGSGTEETRRIVSAAASGVGNTWILTVNEPWIIDPVGTTDSVHVSYIIQDVATVTGLGLINKRVQDYTSSRRLTVGTNAATFAYLAFIDGVSLESVDNSSTTVADVTVETDGRFDMGYIQAGVPTAGAAIFLTPAVDGELGFAVRSGGEFNGYESDMVSVKRSLWLIDTSTTTKIRMTDMRFKFNINDFIIGSQDTDINKVSFLSDNTGTTPRIRVRDWSTGNEVKNILVNNFAGFESVTSGDDPVLRNISFFGMSKLITIATAETWTVVNSIMIVGTTDQADVSIAGTGELLRKFEFRNFSHDLADAPLTAKHYVIARNYRASPNTPTLMNENTADASGLSVQDVEVTRYVDNGGTALTGSATTVFAEISAEYGYIPIIKSITPANEDETVFPTKWGKAIDYAHSVDDFQVQATAATARTLGDTTNTVSIEWQRSGGKTTAHILKWTGGVGALAVGEVIGNNNNTSSHVLEEIIEGNNVAGTGIIRSNNNIAVSDVAQTLDNDVTATWTATYTVGSLRSYDWLIDADTLSPQELYDYLNAKLDEATLDQATPSFMHTVLDWAIDDSNALPVVGVTLGSPNKFGTVRNNTYSDGWAIFNLGGVKLGGITEYQANTGTFVPAATVTLTVHCERKDDNTDIQNVQVIIKRVSDGSTVDSGVTNASGDFSVSFSYTGDVDVTIDVRKSTLPIPRYFPDAGANTIKATGMTQNFLMVQDFTVSQA